MSREDFVAATLRLLAVYIGAITLGSLPVLLDGISTFSLSEFFATILPILLLAGTTAYLWLFPLTFARKILPATTEQRSEGPIAPSGLFAAALFLMGVWLLSWSVIRLTYWASALLNWPDPSDYEVKLAYSQIGDIAASLCQFVLGVVLVVGARYSKRLFFHVVGKPGDGF